MCTEFLLPRFHWKRDGPNVYGKTLTSSFLFLQGGDIFIHAKSNNISKLFELAAQVLKSLPPGSVDKFEDIYSFVYQNGRDLSGFIDGMESSRSSDS